MNKQPLVLAVAAVLAGVSPGAQALEIDPHVPSEVNLDVGIVATADFDRSEEAADGSESDGRVDFEDSSLHLGLTKYMHDDALYGFANFGLKAVAEGSQRTESAFLHQAHAGIGGESFELTLGRTGLDNALIAFPTIRDDDLLAFTHVRNTELGGDAEELQLYGNVARLDWWPTRRVRGRVATTARAAGDAADDPGFSTLNGGHAALAYVQPEGALKGRDLRYVGVGLDYQSFDEVAGEASGTSLTWLAALSMTLTEAAEQVWSLDAQAMVNQGEEPSGLGGDFRQARADSRALVAALRYHHRPYLQTRWQAALTVAWRDYDDFDDASAWALAPSFAWRLGNGLDAVAQLRHRENGDGLAMATGVERDTRASIGLKVRFGATFNESVGARDSLLRLNHDIGRPGPASGGH